MKHKDHSVTPDKDERSRPDGGPKDAQWRDQDLAERNDQQKQEGKLRDAGQIDKGPSACNPTGRR